MSKRKPMEETVTTAPRLRVEPSQNVRDMDTYHPRFYYGHSARDYYNRDAFRAQDELEAETAKGPPDGEFPLEEVYVTAKELSKYEALMKWFELDFREAYKNLQAEVLRSGDQMVIDKPPMYRWNNDAAVTADQFPIEETVVTAKALSRFIPALRTLNTLFQAGVLTKEIWDQYVNDEIIRTDYETQEAIDYGVPPMEEVFSYATFQERLSTAAANSPLTPDWFVAPETRAPPIDRDWETRR